MYRKEFEKILKALTRAVQEVYGERLVSLAVFGSVAQGTPRPDSDIDLLLVGKGLPRGRISVWPNLPRWKKRSNPASPG